MVITDEELTALALAAAGDDDLAPDAQPWADAMAPGSDLLPSWYMPGTVRHTRSRWHSAIVILIVAGFVIINLAGFCITYGHLTAV
jgi:hypothetical protein